MRRIAKVLFGRVDDETVDGAITAAAYGWFAVAAIQCVFVLLALANASLSGGDIVDPIVSALGGFFLIKTKSRGVAVAMLLYGAITAALCIAKALGLTNDGVSLLTAALGVWAGWRGVQATRFWQKRACSIANWKEIVLGTLLSLVITLAALLLLLTGFAVKLVPNFVIEFLFAAVLFLLPVAVLFWFTRRRAFAHTDPACPWPPKPKG